MEKKKRIPESPAANVINLKMDATFFFERALQSLDRFHYDKALKYFRRAVEYDPGNPVNHCNMAGILSEMGDYEESNRILQQILDDVDPDMTECHFYMANNYANMDRLDEAEKAIVTYLELDPNGHFLEEAEEMLDFLSVELRRSPELATVKCREKYFEHDQARALLEQGKFDEAIRLLQKLVEQHPDFVAARNNLGLAYFYTGHYDLCLKAILDVLEMEPGNLHALCNLAIVLQHMNEHERLNALKEQLRKTVPYSPEHLFKLATTMGILGEHASAYQHFKRLQKLGDYSDPSLYHYAGVAAYNVGKTAEAIRLWRLTEKLDPESEISKFYLANAETWAARTDRNGMPEQPLHYHYHLPYEKKFREFADGLDSIREIVSRDPLIRASFFWALKHGDEETKLHVIQALGAIPDEDVMQELKSFVREADENDYLKKVALFVLRSMGANGPIQAVLDGKAEEVSGIPSIGNLPTWKAEWQEVIDLALRKMERRFDMIQMHDLQTLWVEYLSRVYPNVPRLLKPEGWAAALEYWTGRMHSKRVNVQEIADRYGVSAATLRKNAKLIDSQCGLVEKMRRIFKQYEGKL